MCRTPAAAAAPSALRPARESAARIAARERRRAVVHLGEVLAEVAREVVERPARGRHVHEPEERGPQLRVARGQLHRALVERLHGWRARPREATPRARARCAGHPLPQSHASKATLEPMLRGGPCSSLLAMAAPAQAAELRSTIETPSKHVDPATVSATATTIPRELRANVLLPDGYDGERALPGAVPAARRRRRLRHLGEPGARRRRGDAPKGFPGIIVMPEGDRGFYTNWWNDGRRADPGWERYDLDELIPLVERRFRDPPRRAAGTRSPGSRWAAMGATYLASQRPRLLRLRRHRSRASSRIQRAGSTAGARHSVGGVELRADLRRRRTASTRPATTRPRSRDNLRHTRVYVTVGDGTPGRRAR